MSLKRKIKLVDALEKRPAEKKQVIRVREFVKLSRLHSKYLDALIRCIRTFVEVLTFIEVVVLECQHDF